MGRLLLRFFVHPIVIWLARVAFALCAAATIYSFKRWMPAGRVRLFFLDTVPDRVWRWRLQREAKRQAKLLAAEAKGRYLGRRLRQLLTPSAATDVRSRRLK